MRVIGNMGILSKTPEMVSQSMVKWLSIIAGNLFRNIGNRNSVNFCPLLRWVAIHRLASQSCNSRGISCSSAMMALEEKSH